MTAVQKDTLTELDSVEFKLPSMPITKTKFSMEEASNPFGSYSNKNSKDCVVGENFEDEFKSGSECEYFI